MSSTHCHPIDNSASIVCQTRIPIGAYSIILPKPWPGLANNESNGTKVEVEMSWFWGIVLFKCTVTM